MPLPPVEIQRHATRVYAAAGWTRLGSDSDVLVFRRRTQPEVTTALLLFLFGLVPGLLYLALAGRDQTTTIITTPVPDATRLEIVVSWKDRGGRLSVNWLFNSLHRFVGAPQAGVAVR